ncbi:MAG TPA: hypothetical protein VFY38_11440, partial [Pseudonocardia sp.]|nr:hypothetical protein [Pseudonocardia sp.]
MDGVAATRADPMVPTFGRYRDAASVPPFRAVVKARAGVRAAGRRVLDGTVLLFDVLPHDGQRRPA